MTHTPQSPQPVRATVVTSSSTTEYLCAGSGRPLLVLAGPEHRGAIVDAASTRFRVLAPIVDHGDHPLDPARLVDLLDGLGLWDVRVVADGDFELIARACSALHPDRFTSVLVIGLDGIDLPRTLARLAG